MDAQVTAALISGGAALTVAVLGIGGAIAAQLFTTRHAFENSLALQEQQYAEQEHERHERSRREDAYRFAEQRRSTYGRFVRLAREFLNAADVEHSAAENLDRIDQQRNRSQPGVTWPRDVRRYCRAAGCGCAGTKTAASWRIRRGVRRDLSARVARGPASGRSAMGRGAQGNAFGRQRLHHRENRILGSSTPRTRDHEEPAIPESRRTRQLTSHKRAAARLDRRHGISTSVRRRSSTHPHLPPCALSGACHSGAGTAARAAGKNASLRLLPDNR